MRIAVKINLMKKLSFILIAMGMVLVLWPKGKEWYDDWQQKRILEQMEQSISASSGGTSSKMEAEYEGLSRLFLQESRGDSAETTWEDGTAQVTGKAIAIIRIDKINLKLPVLEGATEENMKFAATHMTETAPLDEIGNAAIAAHRARTKGRLFNRLDELKMGDQIILQIKEKQIVYTVYKVSRVEPTDVSVLNGNNVDRVLTLITCDPVVNATHRLIVQAKR